MGCDIHMHVEIKIKGKWEHYSHLWIGRDYDLFARMAGVRLEGWKRHIKFIPPRGLPTDMSVVTALDAEKWGSDGHSASWLTATEAGEIQRWFVAEQKKRSPSYLEFEHQPLFGYLFGNYIDSYVKHPEDGATIRKLGFEDVRTVFWFDN